jgi:uncharacterized membrane-anchored protein
VNFRAYWSDPLWRGLRVITIVTASATIVLLIGYLVEGKSWLVPLVAAVIANVGLNLAFVIRSLIVRARLRRSPGS